MVKWFKGISHIKELQKQCQIKIKLVLFLVCAIEEGKKVRILILPFNVTVL